MKIEATTTRIVLTLKKAIPKNANKNKIKAKMLEKIFFLNPHKTFVSRAATTTFIPAKAFFTVIFSLKPDKNFAITKFMANYNHKRLGIRFDGVLYLGVDFDLFKNNRSIDCLTDIVFIGNNLKYKGIEDYYKVAKNFPKINFHIIGGEGNYDIVNETKKRNLPNVILHGSLSHDKLSEVLKNVQLMFFPSRSEGFPKVTLECAAAGVPSIVYGDYGADEWITTGKDGFVVNTLDEAKNVIEDIIANPDKLKELSKNAVELGRNFDWKSIIKDWETEIEKIINLK